MGFRLPLKAFFRDIVIMCCGSILGLLLARTFVGDSTRDTCLHIVKKSDFSKLMTIGMVKERSVQNYSRDEDGFSDVIGLYHVGGSGRMDEGTDGEVEDGTAGDGEWVALKYGFRIRDDIIGKEWLDVLEYQDNLKQQDKQPRRMSKRKPLLVGVVTEEQHLQTTMNDTTETWGQGSNNLIFYSLQSQNSKVTEKNGGEGGKNHVSRKRRRWKERGAVTDDEIVKVISLDLGVSNVSLLVKAALPVLQHMYTNFIDSFDWFMLVPNDTYIRLNHMEEMLKSRDPSVDTLWGKPVDVAQEAKGKLADGGQEAKGYQATNHTWSCDEGVGMVMSRGLLMAIGRLLQEARGWRGDKESDSGTCFHRNVMTLGCFAQHLGVECIHDDQSRQIFTGADSFPLFSPYTIRLTSPLTYSMHMLHRHVLLQDLYQALSRTNAIKSQLTRNAQKIKQLAAK